MLAQVPTAGMPNGVLWGIGSESDATNAAGTEAQGVPREEGTREQGRETRAKTGRTVNELRSHGSLSEGLGRVPVGTTRAPRHKEKVARQCEVPSPNQRPRIGQLEIPFPVQGFAPSLRGGWWAVARGRTNRSSCKCKCRPGIREPPPSDLQKCTFRPMPLFLFLLPSSWVSGSAQVCNRHLPPRKIQAAPSKTRRSPGIQAPKAPQQA